MQGTLGPYFRVGNKLYAISARHNVFSLNGSDNEDYKYSGTGPKKEVVVMGASAYTNYLVSIQHKVHTFRGRVETGTNVEESQTPLEENEAELTKTAPRSTRSKTSSKLRRGGVNAEPGSLDSSPGLPPGAGATPHHYTRDFCVIELYKEKFKHMVSNVLSLGAMLILFVECPGLNLPLGPQERPLTLDPPATRYCNSHPLLTCNLIYNRTDVSSKFTYPDNSILPLSGMLTADELDNPNLNLQGDHIRHVIKHRSATNTTIGTLSPFMSFVCKYYSIGNVESLELPILSHKSEPGAFAKEGDSESLIVSASGRARELMGPISWIWKLVLDKFPGASLDSPPSSPTRHRELDHISHPQFTSKGSPAVFVSSFHPQRAQKLSPGEKFCGAVPSLDSKQQDVT
ncbi:hypothetical protein PLEOSDRAFT_1107914 [Pleurotus ostreatus PC15]|uniref:Uncharacterized protein n=1 Tax=Pleurotus ostreatus (strain PC15) TaxID=1137138 RepID=A0A067NAD0_PLEO1|nr:hypothetical protein PLEOSDRAFT_1107914 [Pleurotus ostreatus PC15]